jgi:hypothetical protein
VLAHGSIKERERERKRERERERERARASMQERRQDERGTNVAEKTTRRDAFRAPN